MSENSKRCWLPASQPSGPSKKLLIAISSAGIGLIAILILLITLLSGEEDETNLANNTEQTPPIAEEATTPFPKTSLDQDNVGVDNSVNSGSVAYLTGSEMNASDGNVNSDEASDEPQATPNDRGNPVGKTDSAGA